MAGLTASTSSGAQTTTQSPQASVGSGTRTAQSGSVQPGTATSLLNNQGGIPLGNTALSTVKLGTATQTTSGQTQTTPEATHHHINPVALGFSACLLVVAILLFWLTSRSVKSTTEYH